MIVKVADLDVEVSVDDLAVRIDEFVAFQFFDEEAEDRDVLVAFLRNQVKFDPLDSEIQFFDYLLVFEKIFVEHALVEQLTFTEFSL